MRKPSSLICLTLLLVLALLTAPIKAGAGSDLAPAKTLFSLINQRVAYMKDVAAYKWVNDKAIEDKAREEVVIEKTAEAAGKEGLDVESTKLFFRVQIEAAKLIQNSWHSYWKQNGFPKDTKFADLKTEIRPALIDLGNKIIGRIKIALPALKDPANAQALDDLIQTGIDVQYVDKKTKQELLKALTQIESGS